jgi:hypothetical protein
MEEIFQKYVQNESPARLYETSTAAEGSDLRGIREQKTHQIHRPSCVSPELPDNVSPNPLIYPIHDTTLQNRLIMIYGTRA